MAQNRSADGLKRSHGLLVFGVLLTCKPLTNPTLNAHHPPPQWSFRNSVGLSVLVRRENHCLQVDGIVWHCSEGPIRYVVSHWDPEHIPRSPPQNIECKNAPPTRSSLFAAWRAVPDCPREFLRGVILSQNHEGWDSNANARIIWLQDQQLLILGDATRAHLKQFFGKFRKLKMDWVILAHQGNSRSLIQEVLSEARPRRGLLVNGRGRNRKSRLHSKTRAQAIQAKVPLLNTEDWGTLHFH